MRSAIGSLAMFSGLLLAAPVLAWAQPASAPDPVNLAQKQITAYLAHLADLHCRETVTQEKLTGNGHVEAAESEQFDYLIMMDGNADALQLNESRIEAPEARHKLLSMPMLVTNGMTTILLVFHPYYRDSFEFELAPEETVNGMTVVPIHFAHIPGRRTPAALALRGREYPLDLQGTAWLDRGSGDVVKVDASLMHDMSDVGLRSLNIHVEYKPARVGDNRAPMALPALAVVEVTTSRQHWRNRHVFDEYKSFSTDVVQDPNVKVHASTPAPKYPAGPSAGPNDAKEKQ